MRTVSSGAVLLLCGEPDTNINRDLAIYVSIFRLLFGGRTNLKMIFLDLVSTQTSFLQVFSDVILT